MARNPGRKKMKQAARELAYVNKTGTRKSWESSIRRLIREKGYDADEFLDVVLEKCSNFRKIEKMYTKTSLWFKDQETGIQSRVDAWIAPFAKIYFHKDFYWVEGPVGEIRQLPALPMAMEFGHKQYGNLQQDKKVVGSGLIRV